MISESDEYVTDDELEEEVEMPGLEQSPSLDKCGIFPFKSYNTDPENEFKKVCRPFVLP